MRKLEKVPRGERDHRNKIDDVGKKGLEVGKKVGEREKHRKKKKPRNQTPSLR